MDNLLRKQLVAPARSTHAGICSDGFTADTTVAGIPIGKETLSSIGQPYLTKPVVVNRSAVDRLKAAPVSADTYRHCGPARFHAAHSPTQAPTPSLSDFRVLADIVFTLGDGCRFSIELVHYISNSMHANIRKGVARSDFAITAPSGGRFHKAGAAVFIAEFALAADSYPVHKDIFVEFISCLVRTGAFTSQYSSPCTARAVFFWILDNYWTDF
ncbi:hypothetical protein BDZ88DRAFT_454309 [Geranomyces variabilis]|nr:hypothetical protein BDZ88DRAFT_454309 [Geranomyces variabilis]